MENFNCIRNGEIIIPKQEPLIPSSFKERAKFYEAKKLQNESVTDFYTKLLDLSLKCKFSEDFYDRVLCDKFITGFASGATFERLCEENHEITFSEALHLALKYENGLQSCSTEDIIANDDGRTGFGIYRLTALEEESTHIKADPLDYLEVSVPVSIGKENHVLINKSFVCYMCNKPLDSAIQCHQHIARHFPHHRSVVRSTGEFRAMKYFCDICGKSCDRRHFSIHATARKFKCKICGRSFNSSANCRAHVQSHNSSDAYQCSICHRKFKQKRHLKRHLDVHFGAKRFKCNICSQTFRLKATLNNHTRLHETSKLNCDHCKLTFRDQGKYEDHIQKHANVKKQCDLCGKRVKFMKAHMDHHNSPRSHNCTFCEKKFIRRQELVAHEKLHTGLNCFNCNVCGKNFNRQNSLKAHLIRHTSKNFICYQCGKRFFRNDELARHISTHLDAKDFKCDFCDTAFTCSRSKLRHIKNKHPQEK